MDMKVTVSQAVHANKTLLRKILGAHVHLQACTSGFGPEVGGQEPYDLVLLHRRQEAGGRVVAVPPGTESAVLELFA